MDYRARSNAVRAEARAKLLELRNDRLAKRGIMVGADKSLSTKPAQQARVVLSETTHYVTSPEILAALGLNGASQALEVSSPAKKPVTKRPPVSTKVLEKKPRIKKTKIAADLSSVSSAAIPVFVDQVIIAEVLAAQTAQSIIEPNIDVVLDRDETDQVAVAQKDSVSIGVAVGAIDASLQDIPTQVLAVETKPEVIALAPARSAAPAKVRALLDNTRSTMRALPISISSLRPVTEQMNPYSLERLPSIGPGLIWHLQKAGVYSLDDLAHANVDEMVQKLGSITRLMRLKDWISMAKSAQDKEAKTA